MIIHHVEKPGCGTLAQLHADCFPRGWSALELAELLAEPGMISLSEGRPKARGFILCRVVLDEAEILTLAVARECRGLGIGHALLDQAVSRAELAGAKSVFLEVSTRNEAAITLYTKCGFVRGGLRRDYYADGSDALVMEKTLRE
ncbi:MAG: alanine acetyltransferase [Hyphobacterium sp.]|nr:MAG: alanine acetyltransferase [Hyphobacterium sp.]